MRKREEILSEDERLTIVSSLREIREKIEWKPGKDVAHLEKRLRMNHLPAGTSMRAYEESIHSILTDRRNVVYLCVFGEKHYYAVRGVAYKREWLVIFGERGVMETAFPPEDIDDYLERRGFILLDRIGEVLKWTKEAES